MLQISHKRKLTTMRAVPLRMLAICAFVLCQFSPVWADVIITTETSSVLYSISDSANGTAASVGTNIYPTLYPSVSDTITDSYLNPPASLAVSVGSAPSIALSGDHYAQSVTGSLIFQNVFERGESHDGGLFASIQTGGSFAFSGNLFPGDFFEYQVQEYVSFSGTWGVTGVGAFHFIEGGTISTAGAFSVSIPIPIWSSSTVILDQIVSGGAHHYTLPRDYDERIGLYIRETIYRPTGTPGDPTSTVSADLSGVSITSTVAVPEPTSITLAGLGAIGMVYGAFRRRRQNIAV